MVDDTQDLTSPNMTSPHLPPYHSLHNKFQPRTKRNWRRWWALRRTGCIMMDLTLLNSNTVSQHTLSFSPPALCSISLILSFSPNHPLSHSCNFPLFQCLYRPQNWWNESTVRPHGSQAERRSTKRCVHSLWSAHCRNGLCCTVVYSSCLPFPVSRLLSHLSYLTSFPLSSPLLPSPLPSHLSCITSPTSPLLSHLTSLALSPTIQHSGNLLEKLREQMDLCKSFANNKDDCYSHVTDDERDILRNEGNESHTHFNSPYLPWWTYWIELSFLSILPRYSQRCIVTLDWCVHH
jgi:hypothetical protein